MSAKRSRKSTTKSEPEVSVTRLDRFLAFGALGLAVLSIVCFFTIVIASATGMEQADFGTGLWPLVGAIPLWGLPFAFVMIISLLIISFVKKGRASSRS